MAWNQPGNNGQDRDPWGNQQNGNRGGNNPSGNNNKGGRDQGPPDLDDLFRKLSKKIPGFGNKASGGAGKPVAFNGRLIALLIAAFVVIWAVSGFYTIKEAERGVVTRLGKFSHLVQPGLNWKPTFIDHVRPVNIESVRELAASGIMLTADENVVRVEMNVQYRVTDPEAYLFSVADPDDSLVQATDSALRGVIGKYTMDKILTEGRTVVRSDTQRVLEETVRPYKMGITIQDVNFQTARPPEEVKAAFDDAIAARENEQQYIREAEAYANEVQPRANGQAQRILEDAKAYKDKTILESQGEVARFAKLLPEYKAAPQVTRDRLYIETMEKVFSHTRKVVVNDKNNNVMVLPLEQLLRNSNTPAEAPANTTSMVPLKPPVATAASGETPVENTIRKPTSTLSRASGNLMDQRRVDAQRDDTLRIGRN